jgi:histidinol-phosphate aminotransferase
VKQVFPTDANFILIEVENATETYGQLTSKGIVIRDRSKLIPNALRISIGTALENNNLLTELKKLES